MDKDQWFFLICGVIIGSVLSLSLLATAIVEPLKTERKDLQKQHTADSAAAVFQNERIRYFQLQCLVDSVRIHDQQQHIKLLERLK